MSMIKRTIDPEREKIIAAALDTPAGRLALSSAMKEPLYNGLCWCSYLNRAVWNNKDGSGKIKCKCGYNHKAFVEPNNHMDLYYVKSWKRILVGLLDYSKPEAMKWIHSTAAALRLGDEESTVYYEPPLYWIVDPIIPRELQQKLSSTELTQLEHKIFEKLDLKHDFTKETDWDKCKADLKEILDSYN